MTNMSMRLVKSSELDSVTTKGPLRIGVLTPPPSRIDIVSVAKNNLDLIEEKLVFLDGSLSVASTSPIDILARDRDGRLVIIDVFEGERIEWLIYALHHHHYINESRHFFSAIFSPPEINFKLPARLITIVTSIIPPMASALAALRGIDLKLYQARCLSLGDETCIVLENYFAKKEGVVSSACERRSEVDLKPVELTADEIADFLDESDSEDEITETMDVADIYDEETFNGHYFSD